MNDQFTGITTKSWGARIIDSIKGVLFGLLMFVVSFGVLYWNEGRVDMSKIAKTAIEIESMSKAQTETNNQLVSTTGILESDENIGDSFLKEGKYISIERNVEMYSWQEDQQSSTKNDVGGSETTETTYTYQKVWTSNPDNSSDFAKPEGHQNPQMSLNRNSIKVKKAKIGIYDIDMDHVVLPESKEIQLDSDMVILENGMSLADNRYLFKSNGSTMSSPEVGLADNQYIRNNGTTMSSPEVGLADDQYIRSNVSTMSSPEVGDIRISYSVIYNPLETATIFGKLDVSNQKISSYYAKQNTELYRIFEGTRDTAISTMETEHSTFTWVLRAVGFALMWFGLMALLGPISVFLDIMPVFGSISRAGVGLVTFIVSLVLSIITILISMIIHNLIALIVVIAGIIIGIIWFLKNKSKKQSVKANK